MLGGCLVRTAADVVTAPVRIAGAGVDAVTTSQSEADENRGRDIRRREEHLGELQCDYDRLSEKCREGNDKACREAVEMRRQMDAILPTIPLGPEEN
tara:strand:+ start:114 stop:404 length:291 start_codon:yes stop_codon:yes gene_type:complete